MKQKAAYSLLLICLSPCVIWAADLRGFYKNFATVSSEEQWDDVQRVRLKLDAEPAPSIDLQAHYEIRLALRDYQAMENSVFSGLQAPARFLDMEKTLSERNHGEVFHQLDRLRLRLQTDQHEIRLGRQAVSWGSGLVWTPTDIFAGFSPLEIDRDDKPGVDVLRWTWTPSGDTSLDLVFEPRNADASWAVNEDDSALAARVFTRVGEYDLALMAGQVARDRVVGGDFVGYLGNAGLRGEAMQTFAADDADADFFRGLIGFDYSLALPYDPYFGLEYFYNGLGTTEPEDYLGQLNSAAVQRAFLRGNAFNLGRHYLGAVNRFTLTALTSVSTTTLVNLDDQSLRSLLAYSWSARENIDVLIGANIGWGRGNGEFQGITELQSDTTIEQADFLFGFVKVYF